MSRNYSWGRKCRCRRTDLAIATAVEERGGAGTATDVISRDRRGAVNFRRNVTAERWEMRRRP